MESPYPATVAKKQRKCCCGVHLILLAPSHWTSIHPHRNESPTLPGKFLWTCNIKTVAFGTYITMCIPSYFQPVRCQVRYQTMLISSAFLNPACFFLVLLFYFSLEATPEVVTTLAWEGLLHKLNFLHI